MNSESSSPRGRVALSAVLREASATANAQRAATVAVTIVGAVAVFAAVLAGSRAVHAERSIAQRVENAGSRVLVLTDSSGTAITRAHVDTIASLSTVTYAFATTIPVDAVNSNAPLRPVPIWYVYGDLPGQLAELGNGRAIAGQQGATVLGLADGVGAVESRAGSQVAVTSTRPLGDDLGLYDVGVLATATADSDLRELRVLIRSASAASTTQTAILQILDPADPEAISLQSPRALAELQGLVQTDLRQAGRQVVLLVVMTTLMLIGATVALETFSRRRELGRRRALGASRLTLVTLIVARTAIPLAIGGAIGVLVATTALALQGQDAFDQALLSVAAGVLVLVIGSAAAVPAAAVAAWRDPVRVLRTP